ncbi:hypothetical protein TNCV_1742731 [Trichonephila clavipes]|nr:hypothetical protein TNCV_1742731 [Trichonephila clavipes]
MFGSRSLQLDELRQANRRSFEAWILTSRKVFSEESERKSDYTRFLLLYQQWLLRNNSSDWLERTGQGFRTSRLRLILQC